MREIQAGARAVSAECEVMLAWGSKGPCLGGEIKGQSLLKCCSSFIVCRKLHWLQISGILEV